MPDNKNAYVTVLSTDAYLPGVLALFESIKQTNTNIQEFAVVVNEDIKQETKDRLASKGYNVILKPKVDVPDKIKSRNKILPHWNNTFDKFNVFDLTEYKKVVYLDSDIYVNMNIDELFDAPDMSAVASGQSYPGNENWQELNSGVMVIEPKEGVREELIEKMQEMVRSRRKIRKAKSTEKKRFFSNIKLSELKSKIIKRFQGIGDQDVIEEYFGWRDKKELHLDERYNVFANYSDYYADNSSKDNLACVHFTGSKKPWSLTDKELTKLKDKLSGKKKVQCEFLQDYTSIINDEAESYKANFSLIIPMKNARNYIEGALDSVREQEYNNIEIIVIDDDSNDTSRQKVQEYKEKYPNVKIRLMDTVEGHRGPGGARNIGIDNAMGAYILFLDADDKLNEGALDSISKSIALNPDVDIFTLGYQLTRLGIDGEQISNMKLNAGKMQESRFFQIGANTAGSIWNICTRKSLFQTSKRLRFAENCKFEDFPTKVGLFTKTKRRIKSVPHLTHTQFSRPGTSITGTLDFKDMKRLIAGNLEIANLRDNVSSRDKMYINARMVMMPAILAWLVQKCIHNKIDLVRIRNREESER